MKIGLDYWRTITQDTELFGGLARAVIAGGGEVHIVTAVGKTRAPVVRDDVLATGVPHTAIHVVVFDHPKDAPQLKLEKCLELGIQLFVDDRRDTCELLYEHGIIALNILKAASVSMRWGSVRQY